MNDIKDCYRGGFTYVDTDNVREICEFLGVVRLKDLQKLSDVARIYKIQRSVLDYRLKHLEEGVDYIKLGHRQPTLLTPRAVEKIVNIKGDVL